MPVTRSTLRFLGIKLSENQIDVVQENLYRMCLDDTKPSMIKLKITDRSKLLELSELIQRILEDCKDDGY